MPVDLIGYLYAATVAAGGIMGYAKAGLFSIFNIVFLLTYSAITLLCMYIAFHQRFIASFGCRFSIWCHTWFRCPLKFPRTTPSLIAVEYFVGFGWYDGCEMESFRQVNASWHDLYYFGCRFDKKYYHI